MSTVALKDTPNPSRAVTVDGKKFLWDGRLFENHDNAARQAETYKNDSFEVQMVEQDGRHLVYTRRVIREVVVPMS
jgi:hypothetical protein